MPESSGLFTEIHKQAFLSVKEKQLGNSIDILNMVASINIFDFAELSWTDIFLLRKSEFIKEFRKKIEEWSNDTISETTISIERRIQKYIEDAKFDFIKKHSPNIKQIALSSIIGNLPSPIVVNPVSLASGINEIIQCRKDVKQYSWLFFVQKAREHTMTSQE